MQERTLKIIVFVQLIIILLLLFNVGPTITGQVTAEDDDDGLLARRVYAGILPGKSFLITSFYPLERGIKKYIQDNNFNVAVYVENLNNGANFEINAERGYFPASLNKLPIAILVLQKVERGKLNLNEEIRTSSGKEEKLQVLLERMVIDSDNEAFEALSELVDVQELRALLDYYNLNLEGTYSLEGVEGNEDRLGPKQFSNIFSSLYYSTVLEPSHSEYLMKLMSDPKFEFKEISALGKEVTLSHKFGGYYVGDTKFFHDCGVIYDKDIRLLYCIMTQDLEEEHSLKVSANILNSIYTYAKETRERLDESQEVGYLYPEKKTTKKLVQNDPESFIHI